LVFAHCGCPKKNGKLRICVNFKRPNVAMKKDPYLMSFTQEVLDMVVGHKVYSFLDRFSDYHHIMITLEVWYKTTFITKWGVFIWLVMPFGLKNMPPTYQWIVSLACNKYLGVFMKLLLDDFNVFGDLKTHMAKLQLCFDKCQEFGFKLNLGKKYVYGVLQCHSWLHYV
jgi:hypothetical protein